MLEARLLGGFDLQLDGKAVELPSRPAQSLIAYLLLQPDIRHRREKLAGVLWPDSSEQNARTYLRQNLWRLRKALGDSYLLADNLTVALAADAAIRVDVHQLESITQSDETERLIKALEAYRGPLLPGLYDEWVGPERSRLHSVFDRRMRWLMERLEAEARWETLIEWSERWISRHPATEPAYRFLMKGHAAFENRSGVARAYERCQEALEGELGVEPSAETSRLFQRLSTAAVHRPPLAAGNPYRGLSAYREADAPFYYGRERFLARLMDAVQRNTVVAVVGASGSGKTSVLNGGLVPRLKEEGDWRVISLRPGKVPMESLRSAIEKKVSGRRTSSHLLGPLGDMAEGRRTLPEVQDLLEDSGRKWLLVIDPFEEIYTLCEDERQRQAMLDLLADSSHQQAHGHESLVTVVLSLRADFFDLALAHRPFADALEHSMLTLGGMTRAELKRAIAKPADRMGGSFEPGLVERILDDVGEAPGNLPLLAFTLYQLWDHRSGDLLTHEGYEEVGKVEGGLARYAEEIFDSLSTAEQDRARRIFLQLVQPRAHSVDTRRVATRAEMTVDDWHLVGKLADARLVVIGRDAAGQETVEVVHEVLISRWERLSRWLLLDREFRLWQEQLRASIRQWLKNDRDPGGLLRGAPLAAADRWLAERPDDLSAEERSYIEASSEWQRREEEAKDRSRRRTILGLTAAMVSALALAILAGIAWRRSIRAEAASSQAYSLSMSANARQRFDLGDYDSALVLALEANRISDPPNEARRVLREIAYAPGPRMRFGVEELTEEEGAIGPSVALHPDGRHALANISASGEIVLFELDSRRIVRRLEGHRAYINDIDFSSDGSRALTAGDDGLVILWDVETGQILHRLEGHSSLVMSAAFNPEGTLAASAGAGAGEDMLAMLNAPGEIFLWDLESGELLRRLEGGHSQVALDLAFSPDGSGLLSSSGLRKAVDLVPAQSSVIYWDTATGSERMRFEAGLSNPTRLAIRPDGEQALVGTMEGRVVVLNLTTGDLVSGFGRDAEWVSGVSYTPDGRRAVVSHGDGELALWGVDQGVQLARFQHHAGEIFDFELDPGGRSALTTSLDRTMMLWDVTDRDFVRSWQAHEASVTDLAVSVGGRRVASVADDGSVTVWEGRVLNHGQTPAPLLAVDLAEDDSLLLAGDEEGMLHLWEGDGSRELRQWSAHPRAITDVAVGQQGDVAYSSSTDRTIVEWSLEEGVPLRRLLGHVLGVLAFEIAPDGKRAISGGEDGLILWDLASGRQAGAFQGGFYRFSSLAIHPEGIGVLAGSTRFEEPVSYWELASGASLFELTAEKPARDVTVGPTGTVGYFTSEGAVTVIDLESGRERGQLGHIAAAPVTALAAGPGEGTLYLGRADGWIEEWRFEDSELDSTLTWITDNRYVRALTCAERETYLLEPRCGTDPSNRGPGRVEASGNVAMEITPQERTAAIGENRGNLSIGSYDPWIYEGQAGETLSLVMRADQPRDAVDRAQAVDMGLLDTALLIAAPDGQLLATAYTRESQGSYSTDAVISELVLPVDGTYRIEARSFANQYGGPYSLWIESDLAD